MARRIFRRFLPNAALVREQRALRFLGARLHDPNLWHLNRRSVAGGFGFGVFVAFLPFPGQMILAAAGAIALRVHILIAVAAVWITNPVTIPAIFYFCYRLGVELLGVEPHQVPVRFSLAFLQHGVVDIWAPLLVGSVTVGAIAGLAGYGFMRLAWRLLVMRDIARRRRRRALRAATDERG